MKYYNENKMTNAIFPISFSLYFQALNHACLVGSLYLAFPPSFEMLSRSIHWVTFPFICFKSAPTWKWSKPIFCASVCWFDVKMRNAVFIAFNTKYQTKLIIFTSVHWQCILLNHVLLFNLTSFCFLIMTLLWIEMVYSCYAHGSR